MVLPPAVQGKDWTVTLRALKEKKKKNHKNKNNKKTHTYKRNKLYRMPNTATRLRTKIACIFKQNHEGPQIQ